MKKCLVNKDRDMKGEAKMLRLKAEEAKAIRLKNIEINKKLIAGNREPLKESELTHKLIELALENVHITKEGDLEI